MKGFYSFDIYGKIIRVNAIYSPDGAWTLDTIDPPPEGWVLAEDEESAREILPPPSGQIITELPVISPILLPPIL